MMNCKTTSLVDKVDKIFSSKIAFLIYGIIIGSLAMFAFLHGTPLPFNSDKQNTNDTVLVSESSDQSGVLGLETNRSTIEERPVSAERSTSTSNNTSVLPQTRTTPVTRTVIEPPAPRSSLADRRAAFGAIYVNEYVESLNSINIHDPRRAPEARHHMQRADNLDVYFSNNGYRTDAEKINGIDLLERAIINFIGGW